MEVHSNLQHCKLNQIVDLLKQFIIKILADSVLFTNIDTLIRYNNFIFIYISLKNNFS